ncbi:MAG: response regulator transcription factor [Elusimicrobia bacterium]|nr:response regulator transcription factor [Elusimicrobiota bacterium]
MGRTTLLIVDDDPAWLKMMAGFFAAEGFDVRTAGSCAEAVAAAGASRPDCLLLDYHMNDGDGGMVCSSLRSDAALRNTPIIMVSADPAQEIPAYAEYQADGFILKGSPLAKIRAVVDSVLRRVAWERGIIEKGDLRLEKETLGVFRNSKPAVTLSKNQFQLLSLLVERSPAFVPEAEIACLILGVAQDERSDAVRALVHRLRQKLGLQLGRRIKCKRNLGWIYVQPA